MFAIKFWMLILGIGLFTFAVAVVAYDVYVATKLHGLLLQPVFRQGFRRAAQHRSLAPITIFGETARSRAASRERWPKPLWVARLASQERRP